MKNRVFLGNISYQISESELEAAIRDGVGLAPSSVRIITDRETGQPRGFAFVEFDTEAAAVEAIKVLNGYFIGGRPLRADFATERERRSGPPERRHGDDGGHGGGYERRDDWQDDRRRGKRDKW